MSDQKTDDWYSEQYSRDADKQTAQVPLVELLDGVPEDARLTVEHGPTHHQYIPVGRLCREAAAALRAVRKYTDGVRCPGCDAELLRRYDAERERDEQRKFADTFQSYNEKHLRERNEARALLREAGEFLRGEGIYPNIVKRIDAAIGSEGK